MAKYDLHSAQTSADDRARAVDIMNLIYDWRQAEAELVTLGDDDEDALADLRDDLEDGITRVLAGARYDDIMRERDKNEASFRALG